jgi:hypothetical protein
MYNRPNPQRIQQLMNEGHGPADAQQIDRMERRENQLLGLDRTRGLSERQERALDTLQAELGQLMGGPPSSPPCPTCDGTGVVSIDTHRGTVDRTCECVDVTREIQRVSDRIDRILASTPAAA